MLRLGMLGRIGVSSLSNSFQMKPGVFREEYIAIIVRELLLGLQYLHSEGKLHRDIKGAVRRPVHLLGTDSCGSRQHSPLRHR